MSTRYFKATLEAISPSHSRGERRVVFGTAFENQDMHDQAKRIGLIRGLGANKVVSLKEYEDGEEWYEAQYGKGSFPSQYKRHLNTVQTGRF